MIRSSRFRIAAGLLVACVATGSGAQSAPERLSLDSVLLRAERHPEVLIAGADVDAASGGVVAADRAPLPTVSASLASIDLQNGMGPGSLAGGKRLDKGIGVDWVWERGDKRMHRTRSAELGLLAARLDRTDVLLIRQITIAGAFWDLLAAQDREADSAQMLRSAEQMADSARLRLQKGDISEQETARVLIETERARQDDATLRAARRLAAVSLAQAAALVNDQIEAAEGWPAFSASPSGPANRYAPAGPATLPPTRPAIDRLVDQRADVSAARTRVEAARAALDLARASQVSDITWGGGVNHYPPDHRASVQLRAQFPWQLNYRFEGEIRQAVAGLQRAEALLSQTLVAAESELTSLHLRRITTAARLESIETRILERSREVLERAEAAYARGATSLTDLLDARRTFRAVRLDAVQARLDAARADTEWRLRSLSVAP